MKKKLLILLLTGCLFGTLSTIGYAENETSTEQLAKADELASAGNFSQALLVFKKLAPIFEKEEAWAELAHVYLWIGECLYYPGAYQEALDITLKSKEIVDCYLSPASFPEYGMLLQNLGVFYSSLGDFDRQMDSYRQLFNFTLKTKGRISAEGADAFYNLGLAYLRRNQWDKTKAFMDTSLLISTELGYREGRSDALHILATCYANTGDYSRAVDFQRQSLRGNEGNESSSVKMNNLAEYLFNLKEYEEAHSYFERAIALDKENWGPKVNLIRLFNEQGNLKKVEELTDQWINQLENQSLSSYYLKYLYNYKASILVKASNWKRAEFFCRKALTIPNNDPSNDASVLLLLAEILSGKGDQEGALNAIQRAFSIMFPSASLDSPLATPEVSMLLNAEISLELITLKGQIFRKMLLEKHDTSLEQEAISLYLSADELITQNRQRYQNAASKALLAQSAIGLYQDAVELLFDLHQNAANSKWVELALAFSEKSRSIAIAERLNEIHAKVFTKLPQKLVEKENQLLGDITFYSNKVATEGALVEKELLASWEETLFEKRNEQQQFLSSLKKEHPQYFDLKYQSLDLNFDQIRNEILGDEEVLLEYFVGKKHIYLFWLSAEGAGFEQLGKVLKMEENIKAFRRALLFQTADYFDLAYQLFQTLLSPIQEKFPKNPLVLIPDGVLGYIPFETLLSSKVAGDVDFREAPFVLKDHKIRYFFSAQVAMLGQKIANRSAKKEILGISPVFLDSLPLFASSTGGNRAVQQSFPPLLGARTELQTIEKRFPGLYLYGGQATKQAFWEKAGDYNILHIATHTLVDDQHPNASGFVFSSEAEDSVYSFLYAYELFNQELMAELVTLSACNTGYGQIQKGEGIASLARAFAFAGCPNLVMTLWQIKDRTTPEIMERFYENLTKGMGKDVALHEAKLNYLETYNPLFLHPYFWGGIIYVGDQARLKLELERKPFYKNGWALLGLTLVIIALIRFRKFFKIL